jgi:hypothetical protein
MDDAAMQAASQQKQAGQQSSVLGQQGATKQLAQQQGAGQTALANSQSQAPQTPPREIGGLAEEAKRFGKDVLKTTVSLFDINEALGIKPQDDPEKQAKKKKIAQKWQQLTKAEQEYVQQKYQKEMEEKQAQEEEAAAKKKEEEEKKQETIAPPSSPQRGFQGFGGKSGKKKASAMVQRQRTTMNQGDG